MLKTTATGFKAKLGKYMRAVREGKEVIVTDRNSPVARLVPFAGQPQAPESGVVIVRGRDPSAPALGALQIRAIAYRGPSTTATLREDRQRR